MVSFQSEVDRILAEAERGLNNPGSVKPGNAARMMMKVAWDGFRKYIEGAQTRDMVGAMIIMNMEIINNGIPLDEHPMYQANKDKPQFNKLWCSAMAYALAKYDLEQWEAEDAEAKEETEGTG